MEKKYLIAFDSGKENKTLSFVNRYQVLRNLKAKSIPFTYDFNADYTDVIYGSADDYTILHNKVHKNAKIAILALSDRRDFIRTNKGEFYLSQDAVDSYRKADVLFLPKNGEKELLEGLNLADRISDFPLEGEKIALTTTMEKKAFRSYFQIPEKQTVLVTFTQIATKEDLACLETIARLYPEVAILSFYSGISDIVYQKTVDRLRDWDNLRFYDTLPQELYYSMLASVNGLLALKCLPHYPQLLLDFKNAGIPLACYKVPLEENTMNSSLVYSANDFASIYKILRTMLEGSPGQAKS